MAKTVTVRLGYYEKVTVSKKQLETIDKLLEEKGYNDVYTKYITKYQCRNPYRRINRLNADKLIQCLINGDRLQFSE
jgi:hypothetical protein